MVKNTQIIMNMWPNDSYIMFYPEHYCPRWKMWTDPPFCHLLSITMAMRKYPWSMWNVSEQLLLLTIILQRSIEIDLTWCVRTFSNDLKTNTVRYSVGWLCHVSRPSTDWFCGWSSLINGCCRWSSILSTSSLFHQPHKHTHTCAHMHTPVLLAGLIIDGRELRMWKQM